MSRKSQLNSVIHCESQRKRFGSDTALPRTRSELPPLVGRGQNPAKTPENREVWPGEHAWLRCGFRVGASGLALGPVAHAGRERLHHKQEVRGSIPRRPTEQIVRAPRRWRRALGSDATVAQSDEPRSTKPEDEG